MAAKYKQKQWNADNAIRNDRQYKRRRIVDQTQGTRDFNVENPPRKKGKTTGTSQQIFTISGEVTNVGDLQLFLSQDDGL